MPPRSSKKAVKRTSEELKDSGAAEQENDHPNPTSSQEEEPASDKAGRGRKKKKTATTSPTATTSSSSSSTSSSASSSRSVHQFRVDIVGSQPKIWRRILVHSDLTLNALAVLLCQIFEWQGEGYHLHQFNIPTLPKPLGRPSDWFADGEINDDDAQHTVQDVAPHVGDKFFWVYDLGDDWKHQLVAEAIGTEASFGHPHYPICTAGRRCGPAEDSGGIGRYNYIVHIFGGGEVDSDEADGFDREQWEKDTKEQMGFDWDPAKFSVKDINDRLTRVVG